MTKFKVILIVVLVLFLIGAFTTNSHVTNSFCGSVNSIVALATGIVSNIAHGATWIVGSIGNLVGQAMWWIIVPIVLLIVGYVTYRKLRKRYIRNYNEMFEEKYPRRRIQRLADRLDVVVRYNMHDIQLFEDSYKSIDRYESYRK